MDEAAVHSVAAQRHIIRRPRLTRLLDEATSPIILLVAPAGYGKTTLAAQWTRRRRHAWYQCTSASSDLAALASGLTAVVEEIVPAASRGLHERLQTPIVEQPG